ncbi:histidine kinase dimerization/phospho-acceptor domain-containing protein [Stenotrophomonas acidaminiphila]|uniref:sensor histidine kinase n=1 Tax=Stenotrophomonas acidaminiphila TaxID=128780 RepID=UPI00289C2AA6|nr:histidine kinase dimerization/phospho-acceptor domain-containing protein [Stenotrophomonas acidaminiphila]
MWSSERHWLRSIRRRLIVALVGGLGSLLVVLFLLLDQVLDHHLYARLDAQLLDRARAVGAMLASGTPVDALMPEFREHGHTDFYTIWDRTGAVLARSSSSGAQALARPPRLPAAEPLYYDLVLPDGHRGRAVAQPVAPGPAGDPRAALLTVAIERTDVDLLERRIHLSLLLVSLLAALGAAALAIVVVNRGLRPLLLLGRRVGTLSPEAAQVPLLDARLPSELAPLAAALDSAFGRLYDALERERRFARDVAHELRTPLAEIRTSAELALRGGDPGRAAAALAISLAAVERMQRSVDGLLALSRYESGQAEPQPEPLDLRALLEQQRQVLARATSAGARIQLDGAVEWWTSSDVALLERIVANLLQNAAEYAPPGSRIVAGVRVLAEGAWLEVRNPAPDLHDSDLPRLGERFWRKRPEHAPDTHGGLGLALARTLARILALDLQFRLEAGELVARLGPFPALPEA